MELWAYALVPFGDTEQRLNSHYQGGALDTYGLDVGYFIAPEINASVGYYYQQGDDSAGNSSGVKGRLAFAVADDVEFGGTYTYDNAFNARASADLTIRFGGGSHKKSSNEQAKAVAKPQIKQLSAIIPNRNVRVHDDIVIGEECMDDPICRKTVLKLFVSCFPKYCRSQTVDLGEKGMIRKVHFKDSSKE